MLFLNLSLALDEDGGVKMLLVSVWSSDCCVMPAGARSQLHCRLSVCEMGVTQTSCL